MNYLDSKVVCQIKVNLLQVAIFSSTFENKNRMLQSYSRNTSSLECQVILYYSLQKLIASWNRKSNKQPKAESKKIRKKLVPQKQPLRLENKERFLEEREGWIKQKLNDISQQGRKSNGMCYLALPHSMIYICIDLDCDKRK